MPVAEQDVVVDGVRLRVWTWPGSGATPFLLAHGLSSNAHLWDGVALELARLGHPVVTVDLRGHGRSNKPDDGYDIATVAADLVSLIEGLGLDRPVVAGQSWGGNVALEVGWSAPEVVRGIACVDGGWIELSQRFADWDTCARALAPPPLEGRRAVDIQFMLRAAHPRWPETGIAGTLANFDIHPDGTVTPCLSRDRHMQVLRGLWEHRPSDRFASVKVPVLLVPADDGAEGLAAKREEVARAASSLAVSRTHWFTSHHDIHAERPTELAAVLHGATADGFFR